MLDVNELIYAYSKGYFPMADPDEDEVEFYQHPSRMHLQQENQLQLAARPVVC